MAKNAETLTTLLFLAVLCLSHAAEEDPELKLCKKQCQLQTHFDEWERQACQQQCEEYAKQKAEIEKREAACREERERLQLEHCKHECRSSQLTKEEQDKCEQRCEEGYRGERDGEGPEERLEHCRHQCQSTEKGRREQQRCRSECEEKYRGEREDQGRRASC